MKFKKRTLTTTLVATTVLGMGGGPAWADEGRGAALFGGMVIGGAMQRNRQAQQSSAYQSGYSQGQASAAPPPQAAQSGGSSAEARLKNLDSLYRDGLISKEEYTTRRKGILDEL
jgi:hypothetical protein